MFILYVAFSGFYLISVRVFLFIYFIFIFLKGAFLELIY